MHDDLPQLVHLPARYLLLPGWQGSGEGHWQAAWARQANFTLVEQADWEWPRRGDWTTRLEDVIDAHPGPIVLVAHSLGCHLLAHWASLSGHVRHVEAALLVAPPDLTRPELPPQLESWRTRRAADMGALPFRSLVLGSSDDPYASLEQTRRFASAWGAEFQGVGALGHINADSGLNGWPQGLQILQDFLSRRSPIQES